MERVCRGALLLITGLLVFVPPGASAANDLARSLFGPELTLVCDGAGGAPPRFRNTRTGKLSPILDARLRAIADRVCNPLLDDAPASVTITNSRSTAIFVSFTLANQTPGPITWGAGCTATGGGAQIASGFTCQATVPTTVGSSRFCAALDQPPANCYNAQTNHQTMVETTFETASNPGCFNKGSCVWYDISVIPSTCTDALWKQDQCANTGGAAYNLPVALACAGSTTFTCQGPANTTYGPANYPSQCGNPNATCVGNTGSCVQAYFYPMFDPPENKYAPNVPCLGGQVLNINFLAGQ
jgi:hypothetical protein